jgi:Na+-transporting methylmalonyl-CoA/oxaloacetate decarboxylase gamma subunit
MAGICNIAPLPIIGIILYVAILIYFVWLAGRFVRAIEKIADKFEKRAPTN